MSLDVSKHNMVIRGAALGASTGLLTTLIESIIILLPNIYTPPELLFFLAAFNVLFWTVLGVTAGYIIQLLMRSKKVPQTKEIIFWIVFFLCPFALIYGIVGQISPPSLIYSLKGFDAYHHHLTFGCVAIVIFFCSFYNKKSAATSQTTFFVLLLEVATIILFFLYCSNVNSFLLEIPLGQQKLFYLVGVSLIFTFYFMSYLLLRRFLKKPYHGNSYKVPAVLLIVVVICLTIFYKVNKVKFSPQMFSGNNSGLQIKSKKIPNVFLVVLDTVRADSLSIYGSHNTTKNLFELSKDAVVFENCFASSSWTAPSHASLFTGLYPREHGVHTNSGLKGIKGIKGVGTRPLPDNLQTLAEYFRDNGHKTAAVVSNFAGLNTAYNLDKGFQLYDVRKNIGHSYWLSFRPLFFVFCSYINIYPKCNLPYRTADDINKELFHLVDAITPSPFFVFANYMDAHKPYCSPPVHGNTFFDLFLRLKFYLLDMTNNLSDAERDAFLLSSYDKEILFLDKQIGKFITELKSRGLYKSSLIVIVSDHGELFGHKGYYDHRGPLYAGSINVPLLIKFPNMQKTGREKDPISLSDIYPTILSICELEIPKGISGKAFGDSSSPIVAELYSVKLGEHRILHDGNYKYMVYEKHKNPELYDIRNNPIEQKNLAGKFPDIKAKMGKKLTLWKNTHRPKYQGGDKNEQEPSEDLRNSLKALGYIQ